MKNPKDDLAYRQAEKKFREMKGFYIHATAYVLVNIFIIFTIVKSGNPVSDIKNYAVAFFWGIGLLAHGISVFLPGLFWGREWEEKKIRKLMDKKPIIKMKYQNEDPLRHLTALKQVKRRKDFYIHVVVYLLINLMIFFMRSIGDDHIKIHPYLTVVIWGLFLLMHGFRTFFPELLLGKKWEEKKINELLNKHKH